MLASIQKIKKIHKHPNAHSLDIAYVLGWQTVVKKGEFKEGDLVVYVQIDSVLPEAEWCEFMRERGWRVRSVKFRGELSQGMIFPLSILPHINTIYVPSIQTDNGEIAYEPFEDNKHMLGIPVNETLGITKFERPLPKNTDALRTFPLHSIFSRKRLV